MKRDLKIFVTLPFLTLSAILVIAFLLHMSNLISIQFSFSKSIDFILILFILYYLLISFYIYQHIEICEGKKTKVGHKNHDQALYGKETRKQIEKLEQSEEYKEWKKQVESGEKVDRLIPKKNKKQFPIQNDVQDEDFWENEFEYVNSHKIATLHKLF